MIPKLLVCTVESWNSKVGANTFSTILSNYPPENIANICIRPEVPDSPACSRYFQITEQKVIKSIFKRSIKTGREVEACGEMDAGDEAELQANTQLYNKNRKKRSVAKLLIREVLWKLGRWKTPELDAFLDSFKPDIIVFGMEGYIHFNRLCRYAIKRTGAKAVGYFWDDTFTYKQRGKYLNYRILRFFQRRSLKKLASCCDGFWAITNKTKQEADAFFGINCQVLTKPIDYAPGEQWTQYTPHDPIKMIYTGNLLTGRFQAIQAVSKALEKVNADGVKMELDVYSASYIAPEELDKLSKYVHMKGVVPQSEVLRLQKETDILLFAEPMYGPCSQIDRLSFSTKLTDYFHSGKCIFAVGCTNLAPMEYLVAEEAALCAEDEESVLAQIRKIVENPEIIYRTAENAYLCGKKNHARQNIQKIIDHTFQDVLRNP